MRNQMLNNEQQEEYPDVEDFIHFHTSWVGPMVNGTCTYYQDRDKQYKFYTEDFGFKLLNKLLEINGHIFRANHELVKASGIDPEIAYAEGKKIYCEKMALTKGKGTWSQEEYCHPGFQRMYLHIKSFRGLTETWSLLERAATKGLFDTHKGSNTTIRIASICGGPGYELQTAKMFFGKFAPEVPVELISLDLCSSWKTYAELLGIRFVHWDANDGGLLDACGYQPGELTYIIISYGMIHCSQMHVLDMYSDLLLHQGVRALLVSERNQRLQACAELEGRGLNVVRLMDQSREQDERQIAVVGDPSLFHSIPERQMELSQERPVFPNNPYSLAEFLDYYKRKSKSKMCSDFLRTGHCPFGERCKFAHKSEELKDQGHKKETELSWRKEQHSLPRGSPSSESDNYHNWQPESSYKTENARDSWRGSRYIDNDSLPENDGKGNFQQQRVVCDDGRSKYFSSRRRLSWRESLSLSHQNRQTSSSFGARSRQGSKCSSNSEAADSHVSSTSHPHFSGDQYFAPAELDWRRGPKTLSNQTFEDSCAHQSWSTSRRSSRDVMFCPSTKGLDVYGKQNRENEPLNSSGTRSVESTWLKGRQFDPQNSAKGIHSNTWGKQLSSTWQRSSGNGYHYQDYCSSQSSLRWGNKHHGTSDGFTRDREIRDW